MLKVIEKFLKSHKNSETDILIGALKNNYYYPPTIIDSTVSWSTTKEGFYYFYFLQVRLLLAVALFYYKNDEFDKCRIAVLKGNSIIRYSDGYDEFRVTKRMPINQTEYWNHKEYYTKQFQNISKLIVEKSF